MDMKDYVSANQIIPRVWIGNIYAALDDEFLDTNNIQVIINCTKDLTFHSKVIQGHTKAYRLPIDDNLKEREIRNMTLWGPEAVYYMLKEYFEGNNILVHCAAGIQRSAAVVAMFLIALKGFAPEESISFIKSKRSITFNPSVNFKKSIHHFYEYYNSNIIPILPETHDSTKITKSTYQQ